MAKIDSTPPPLPPDLPPQKPKASPSGPFSGLRARISGWFKKDSHINPLLSKSIQSHPKQKTSGLASFLNIFKSPKSELKETLRANMIAHLESIKKQPLTVDEIAQVDEAIATLEKVDNSIRTKFTKVKEESLISPFKVRKVVQIKIGGIDRTLEMGRNYKVTAQNINKTVIGQGSYGAVHKAGILLKVNVHILKKTGFDKTDSVPEDLEREVKMTTRLHKARGVQRPPYGIFSIKDWASDKKQYGYLVPGYETDLKPQNILKLDNEAKTSLGLKTNLGRANGGLDLLTGLVACHKAGIYHRDIKPENIGIELDSDGKPEWVLADFGIATTSAKEPPKGTFTYMLAIDAARQDEHLNNTKEKKLLLEKQDVFAVGLSLIETYYTAINDQNATNSPWKKEFNKLCCTGYVFDEKEVFIGMTYPSNLVDNSLHPLRKHPANNPAIAEVLNLIGKDMGQDFQKLLTDMIAPPSARPTASQALTRWTAALATLPTVAPISVDTIMEALPDHLKLPSTLAGFDQDLQNSQDLPIGSFLVWKPSDLKDTKFLISQKTDTGPARNMIVTPGLFDERAGFFVEADSVTSFVEAGALDELVQKLGFDATLEVFLT
ncbi:MAG: hypothetical protein LLF94_05885 [Chlamydiales bacterium]|nr:hypothetical protein [Chlamydiales bacterium]